jgi:hypothetical protein
MAPGRGADWASIPVNRQLYHRFSKLNLPRHTSYPALPYWVPNPDHSGISDKLPHIA